MTKFHSPQATAGQTPEEIGPERFGLRRTDLHAQDFPPAIAIGGDGDYGGDGNDAAGLAHLEVGGVDPQVGPVAFNGAMQEGLYRSSISAHRRETWLLEMPLMPIACTTSSTDRVEMPCT